MVVNVVLPPRAQDLPRGRDVPLGHQPVPHVALGEESPQVWVMEAIILWWGGASRGDGEVKHVSDH